MAKWVLFLESKDELTSTSHLMWYTMLTKRIKVVDHLNTWEKHLTNLQSTLNFIKHSISVVSNIFKNYHFFSMLIWAISMVRLWYSPPIASLWLCFGIVLCFAYDLTNMSRSILILYKKLQVWTSLWSDGKESASNAGNTGSIIGPGRIHMLQIN